MGSMVVSGLQPISNQAYMSAMYACINLSVYTVLTIKNNFEVCSYECTLVNHWIVLYHMSVEKSGYLY